MDFRRKLKKFHQHANKLAKYKGYHQSDYFFYASQDSQLQTILMSTNCNQCSYTQHWI